jgi:acyl-coenzyme A thioesterase PaaI-like protein
MTHGGMLTTLADGALGINLALARGKRGAQVTVSLTADFLSGARVGDWLEAHVVVTRMGQRLAYANCDLKVGARHVLRSSAVFAFVDRPLPPALAGSSEPPLTDG